MKHILTIILLATALIWTVNITGLVRHDDSRPTPQIVAMPTIESTPLPECNPGEHYDPLIDRCWPDNTPAPTSIPPDIQTTMDADPYDNDYQYIEWCFDYVDNGARIIYYECPMTDEP